MTHLETVSPRFLGGPRLQRLLDDCNDDVALAHDLFVWNVRACGAAMEALHVFELILRNALDGQLRAWHESLTGRPEWLIDPHVFVTNVLTKSEYMKARNRASVIASAKGRPASHDDVLAQLSFGNWRYLLPSRAHMGKQKLWDVALRNAFTVWPGEWESESIVSRVANAHELRNRVAHLEPLHSYDLRRARREMRSVCHAIGPDAARFFVQAERLLPVIEANPLSRNE